MSNSDEVPAYIWRAYILPPAASLLVAFFFFALVIRASWLFGGIIKSNDRPNKRRLLVLYLYVSIAALGRSGFLIVSSFTSAETIVQVFFFFWEFPRVLQFTVVPTILYIWATVFATCNGIESVSNPVSKRRAFIAEVVITLFFLLSKLGLLISILALSTRYNIQENFVIHHDSLSNSTMNQNKFVTISENFEFLNLKDNNGTAPLSPLSHGMSEVQRKLSLILMYLMGCSTAFLLLMVVAVVVIMNILRVRNKKRTPTSRGMNTRLHLILIFWSMGLLWRTLDIFFSLFSPSYLETLFYNNTDAESQYYWLIYIFPFYLVTELIPGLLIVDTRSTQFLEPQSNIPESSDMENVPLLGGSSSSIDESKEISQFIIPLKEIVFGRIIGEGAFGVVYKGKWKNVGVAIKKVRFQNDEIETPLMADFWKEVKILQSLRHPNTVLYLGTCVEPGNLCLITEFCEKGSLENYLRINGPLSVSNLISMSKDVCLAMIYLHSKNMIHRDLKSANLLITKDMRIKVADFGITKLKEQVNSTRSAEFSERNDQQSMNLGTCAWCAPEVLRNQRFSEQSDVYSFGIILWEMATGDLPFVDYENDWKIIEAVTEKKMRPAMPPRTPHSLRYLIEKCWSEKPDRRLNFREIYEYISTPSFQRTLNTVRQSSFVDIDI